jgi:hypothetical protein
VGPWNWEQMAWPPGQLQRGHAWLTGHAVISNQQERSRDRDEEHWDEDRVGRTSSTMDPIYHAFRAQTGGAARNRPAPVKDRRMTEAVFG